VIRHASLLAFVFLGRCGHSRSPRFGGIAAQAAAIAQIPSSLLFLVLALFSFWNGRRSLVG